MRVYALVQTALVQDEALKRADDRIQELEAARAVSRTSIRRLPRFDARRDLRAEPAQPRGSVPNVRAPDMAGGSRPVWNTGQVMQQTPGARTIWPAGLRPAAVWPAATAPQRSRAFGGGGGSFLGTAAAAAAGVVGGSLLVGSIRSMMGGGGNQQAFGDTAGHSGGIEDRRPWSDQSGGNLARDAGINDIGSSRPARRQHDNDSGSRQGFFDQASHDDDDDDGSRFRRLRRRRWRRQRLRLSDARCEKRKRPPDRAAVLISSVRASGPDQITTTLAPTLTRP